MKELLHRLFHEHRRQTLTLLLAAFIVFILLFTGIFSYLRGKDTVTNRMAGKNGSIVLLEPKWDQTGQYMAGASEPGMQIDKDPYAYNDGQTDLYVRLVMTVRLGSFDDKGKTALYKDKYTKAADRDTRRLRTIAEAIRYVAGELDTQLLTLNTDGAVTGWTVESCANEQFCIDYDKANHSGTDDELTFYFYYTAGDDMMQVVRPKEYTDKLFQRVDIPIYKADYLGVFDQKYDIVMQAEAIPAANFPEGLTAADAPQAFADAQ